MQLLLDGLLAFLCLFVFVFFFFFFFNDTATTEIYRLSLHDALPIFRRWKRVERVPDGRTGEAVDHGGRRGVRSEEHTSELQSPCIAYAVFCLKIKVSLGLMRGLMQKPMICAIVASAFYCC